MAFARLTRFPWLPGFLVWLIVAPSGFGAPVTFSLPAQPAAAALLEFSRQSGADVLFSSDELRGITTAAVAGTLEPEAALATLLTGTGLSARRTAPGRFVVSVRPTAPRGSLEGWLLSGADQPAPGVRVVLRGTGRGAVTDRQGRFRFARLPAGVYHLDVDGNGFHPLQLTQIPVGPGEAVVLAPQRLTPAAGVTQLAPFIVEAPARAPSPFGDDPVAPRHATGNLDLPRTRNDVLPFQIYGRAEISRSGVVDLNEFLQRVILENAAVDQSPPGPGFVGGGLNLQLRGYTSDETVVLVNGRRLPEVMTAEGGALPPDVDFIPLGLVQQVEVLPSSASSLYTGNPVGGVINVILRPDIDATEVTATYTNRLGGFDAPHHAVALQHGQSLLGNTLRLRLSMARSRAVPPNESELGHRQRHDARDLQPGEPLFRATPNLRSADGGPLFGPGSPSFTSVAPGADGLGGRAAFAGREGVANRTFFDAPEGLSSSLFSLDAPYGRAQQRDTAFASITYDVTPWLQLGLDAAHARTVVERGHEVFAGTLTLAAAHALNPFGRDVIVTLNETATGVGADYSRSRTDFTSVVGGALVSLPRNWRLALDGQYARNVARYRGFAASDTARWQALVDAERYQMLRDTQVFEAPPAFVEEVVVFQGGRGETVRIGDFSTLEAAARLTNPALPLPTGEGVLNLGADYRRSSMAPFTDERRRGDGSLVGEPIFWQGRRLERYSVFGELQAPVLPQRRRPRWMEDLTASLAVRYVAADSARETNVAPTAGFKLTLASGVALRASFTTSNRYPPPRMSSRTGGTGGPGSGLTLVPIVDPRRNERYEVTEELDLAPALSSESAVTQTAGLIYQRGDRRRIRISLDYVDTRKTDEHIGLEPQAVVDLEDLFPDRITRAPGADGLPGRIRTLLTGAVNAASRRSENWNLAVDYARADTFGGVLELRSRVVVFQRYDLQLFANSPVVDQIREPDGAVPGLLRYRAHFNAGWSGPRHGFGIDGQYFHSRILPLSERPAQGSDRLKGYWQFDAYLQTDLSGLLPGRVERGTLRAQLRVNNVFGFDPPKFANERTGAGVLSYGDWRGRVYSVSLTTAF